MTAEGASDLLLALACALLALRSRRDALGIVGALLLIAGFGCVLAGRVPGLHLALALALLTLAAARRS